MRRKAQLESNNEILPALESVHITCKDAVSEVVAYATIGANLLTDLTFVLVENQSDVPFFASDAPVVLHNRLYERQRINVIGYANVGLQLFLPLGSRLALFGYDCLAYDVKRNRSGIVRLSSAEDVRLINSLQLEAAHAVLLVKSDTPEDELRTCAESSRFLRKAEKVVFNEEVVSNNGEEIRTRQGGGAAPSRIELDLSVVTLRQATPPQLAEW